MRLIQEKQSKILEGEQSGKAYDGKDMLTLLCTFSSHGSEEHIYEIYL